MYNILYTNLIRPLTEPGYIVTAEILRDSYCPAFCIYPEEIMKTKRIVLQATIVGIAGNILLSAFKLFAGIFGHSAAMISDAVHSLSDVVATAVAFTGVKLAGREADDDHPYGHERFECVASIFLSAILFVTGIGIGYEGAVNISSGNVSVPGTIAITAAIVSIAIKEAMFWYTRYCAKKINSSAFMADAWHHRSDALSSIGALIGIVGARMGYPVFDSIASIVICAFIIKVAVDVFREALGKMTDKAASDEFEQELKAFILSHEGLETIDMLKTRQFGEKVYVDLEIGMKGDMSLKEAHDVAAEVHKAVEKKYHEVKHIMIHMNPID